MCPGRPFSNFSLTHWSTRVHTLCLLRVCGGWGGRRTMCRIGLVTCILVVSLRLGAGGGEYFERRRFMGCGSSDAERAPAYASQLRDPPNPPRNALLVESMGTGAAVICEVPMAHNELGGLPFPNEAAQRHRACAWRLSLRGGRSKRSGKRVRKALEESGGTSTAAARFPTGSWQSKASNLSSTSPSAASDRADTPGGGRLGYVRDHKKPKKLSNRQLAMAARQRHREGMAGLFADVDPTRDPAVELWEKGMDAYLSTPLYGAPSFEDAAQNSTLARLIRESEEWEGRKTARSVDEIRECEANGTYFRLPKKVKEGIGEYFAEGATSPPYPHGFSLKGELLIAFSGVEVNRSGVADMLDRGANASYQNMQGETALHHSALYGNVEVVQLLLEAGADANVPNYCNYTALDYNYWSAYGLNLSAKVNFPAPCASKDKRGKIKRLIEGAGGHSGKGIGWRKLEEMQANGMLDRWDEVVKRMPFDLLQWYVDIGIVPYHQVSHRYPSSIHSGVSPWVAVARRMGINVTVEPAFTEVDMDYPSDFIPDDDENGAGGGVVDTVEELARRMRDAKQVDSEDDPDVPSSQMPPASSNDDTSGNKEITEADFDWL